jgi:hypothetical protein
MSATTPSRQNQRNQKSRPERLAQHHLAYLNYIKDCEERGEPVDFESDECMRFILRVQSGSYVHHRPQTRNQCDANDPLRHILKDSTICGDGTDLTVFRVDPKHLAVRLWIDQHLAPIMDELDAMEREWHQQQQQHRRQGEPNASSGSSSSTNIDAHVKDMIEREEVAAFDNLTSPTGISNRPSSSSYDPQMTRPLY